MRARISARLLNTKSATPADKPFEIRDDLLKGFILRVQPSGARTYYVQIARNHRVKIGAVGVLTPDEARERASKILGNHAHGRDPLDGLAGGRTGSTLSAFIENTYSPHLYATRPNGAAATVKRLIGRFKSLGNRDLAGITSGDLERWKAARLAGGATPATVQRDLMPLSGVFKLAKKLRLIADNPVADVDKLRLDTVGKLRYLTPSEEARLRVTLAARDQHLITQRQRGNKWRADRGKSLLPVLPYFGDALTPAVLISLNTGVRLGELLKLRWSSVDFESETLTVSGGTAKSGKTRHVPLNADALYVLRQWRSQSGDDLVIGIATSFKKSFATVLIDAQVEHFRWHDLRHTFASKLAQRGIPINTVRELLGHSTLTMTLRYAHLSPDNRRAAVKALDP
jgi:integrase